MTIEQKPPIEALPPQCQRFTLTFSAENYNKAVTYHLVKDYDLKINILKAEITPGEEGHLLVEMEGTAENLQGALIYLKNEHIKAIPTNRQVLVDKDHCVHCGACTAVCFSGAMVINRDTWQVEFLSEKCIVCGLCIDACPLNIIKIGFGSEFDAVKNGKFSES